MANDSNNKIIIYQDDDRAKGNSQKKLVSYPITSAR